MRALFESSASVRTIAIVNQKGGCGKTTTAINLAAVYARRGMRTLVIDMDPQSHCAAGLGVPEDRIENHIGTALISNLAHGFNRAGLVWEVARNLDLAPSTMALAALEAPGGGLHALPDRDRRLALLLRHLSPHYDRCLIDCPPTIGLLTYNALRAAGEAIIPVETGFFALRGARKQWETIRNLVDRVQHPIDVYVLPTLYDGSQSIARDILESVRRQFGGRVIPVVIEARAEIREAASFGQPVAEYAPESQARENFEALASWLEAHPADPPEPPDIQIEVARSVSMPFARPDTPTVSAGEGGFVVRPQVGGGAHVPAHAAGTAATRAVESKGFGDGSRAAEMARRVRELAIQRTNPAPAMTERVEPPAVTAAATASPTPPRPTALVEPRELEPERDPVSPRYATMVRLFGVKATAQGVLFVQPGSPGTRISIAGDFNQWSASATPMRYNRESSVYELLLPLPRGRYEYRLVVDGQWQADPYNPNRRRNEYGEENNFFTVE